MPFEAETDETVKSGKGFLVDLLVGEKDIEQRRLWLEGNMALGPLVIEWVMEGVCSEGVARE